MICSCGDEFMIVNYSIPVQIEFFYDLAPLCLSKVGIDELFSGMLHFCFGQTAIFICIKGFEHFSEAL